MTSGLYIETFDIFGESQDENYIEMKGLEILSPSIVYKHITIIRNSIKQLEREIIYAKHNKEILELEKQIREIEERLIKLN